MSVPTVDDIFTSVRGAFQTIDWHAFFAGLTFMAAMVASAGYVRMGAASGSLLNDYSAILVSLFIGSTTGHYWGKSLEPYGNSVNSAYLGAAAVLFVYWAIQNRISLLTASLVLITISLILSHQTSLIADSDYIRKSVEYFAEGLSPVGLVVFGVLKFVTPSGVVDDIVRITVQSLSQEVVILSARLNVVVFIGLLGLTLLIVLFIFFTPRAD